MSIKYIFSNIHYNNHFEENFRFINKWHINGRKNIIFNTCIHYYNYVLLLFCSTLELLKLIMYNNLN